MGVAVSVGVLVGVCVPVAVALGVTVSVGVSVGAGVAVPVDVGCGVVLGVGLRCKKGVSLASCATSVSGGVLVGATVGVTFGTPTPHAPKNIMMKPAVKNRSRMMPAFLLDNEECFTHYNAEADKAAYAGATPTLRQHFWQTPQANGTIV